jgi:hypothetical protein
MLDLRYEADVRLRRAAYAVALGPGLQRRSARRSDYEPLPDRSLPQLVNNTATTL